MSTILITGGYTGVGLAIVKALLESATKDKVLAIIITSRSLERAQAAVRDLAESHAAAFNEGHKVVPYEVDLDDDASIDAFVAKLEDFEKLDVLINNAGISLDPDVSSGKITFREAALRQTSTNVIAPYVLTRALMPLLFASSSRRIIFVSSEMGSIAGMQSDLEKSRRPPAGWPKAPHFAFPSYRASKAAVNMIAADWRHELANDGFTIHAVCPGFVATGLGGLGPEVLRSWGAGDASNSGRFIRDVVDGKRDDDQLHMIRASGIIPY